MNKFDLNSQRFGLILHHRLSNRRSQMAKGMDKGAKDKAQNKDKKKVGIKEKRKIKQEKEKAKKG